jgi:hypothetical protein
MEVNKIVVLTEKYLKLINAIHGIQLFRHGIGLKAGERN